jgi:hypothetical protein
LPLPQTRIHPPLFSNHPSPARLFRVSEIGPRFSLLLESPFSLHFRQSNTEEILR